MMWVWYAVGKFFPVWRCSFVFPVWKQLTLQWCVQSYQEHSIFPPPSLMHDSSPSTATNRYLGQVSVLDPEMVTPPQDYGEGTLQCPCQVTVKLWGQIIVKANCQVMQVLPPHGSPAPAQPPPLPLPPQTVPPPGILGKTPRTRTTTGLLMTPLSRPLLLPTPAPGVPAPCPTSRSSCPTWRWDAGRPAQGRLSNFMLLTSRI